MSQETQYSNYREQLKNVSLDDLIEYINRDVSNIIRISKDEEYHPEFKKSMIRNYVNYMNIELEALIDHFDREYS